MRELIDAVAEAVSGGSGMELAPAKINLALHVLGRRGDGYHEIDSIVAFANVGDTLRFSPAPAAFTLTADGPFAGDLPAAGCNIIIRARRQVAEIAAGSAGAGPWTRHPPKRASISSIRC